MKGQRGFVQVAPPVHRFSLLRGLRRLAGRLQRWYELGLQRRTLATMDDRALKDLGLSRADIFKETERPFWDDPMKK